VDEDRQDPPDLSALADRAGRLAGALVGAGLGHGDRILWLGQNRFGFWS